MIKQLSCGCNVYYTPRHIIVAIADSCAGIDDEPDATFLRWILDQPDTSLTHYSSGSCLVWRVN